MVFHYNGVDNWANQNSIKTIFLTMIRRNVIWQLGFDELLFGECKFSDMGFLEKGFGESGFDESMLA